jgi:lincosamide nucleotidyltransferase
VDRDTPEAVESLCASLVNSVLFGTNLLARGEAARALEKLGGVQRVLLWMARLVERATAHWPTPSRALEKDLSAQSYARFVACTAVLDEQVLWGAYRASWDWGQELLQVLAQRHALTLPAALLDALDGRLAAPGKQRL